MATILVYNCVNVLLDNWRNISLKLISLLVSGILYGTLTMEYGGKVSIECAKTGYKTDMEFKLKVSAFKVHGSQW